MEHENWRDLISLDCDGRLPAGDRGRLDAHLSECGECRLFADGVIAASSVLRQMEPPKRSEAFVQSVMARIPEVPEFGVPLRWLVPAFGAAFAVAIAVWTPTVSSVLPGPASLVTASLDEPVLQIWGESR